MGNSLTPFGVKMNKKQPLAEYPRPQLVRSSYCNLNGLWQYALCQAAPPAKANVPGAIQAELPQTAHTSIPAQWDGTILVPFCPESLLSGVGKALQPGDTLWYRRNFTIPAAFIKSRVLLHFGAVDQNCTVFVNGMEAGTHQGGFTPFSLDITKLLRGNELELIVQVQDPTDTAPHPRGRQRLEKGGPWHSAFSGIWQTVWMESVPKNYIQALRITPLYDEGAVEIDVQGNTEGLAGNIEIYARTTLSARATFTGNGTVRVPLAGALSWSPSRPFLYTLRITAGEDNIESYFGMRKIHIEHGEDGHPRLMLNNKPFVAAGLLDQGMYSDGMPTPPTDSAMIEDIKFARECGFNVLQRHGTIAPLRWYHHCDRLGMLVWQDLPAGGDDPHTSLFARLLKRPDKPDTRYKYYGRQDAAGRESYLTQLKEAVDALYNTVSLGIWSLFQDGQGQFDSVAITAQLHQIDPTRLIDHAGGGPDQGAGNIVNLRLNAKTQLPEALTSLTQSTQPRALALTSAGCIGLIAESTTPNPAARSFAQSKQQLDEAFTSLYTNILLPLRSRGLCAVIIDQLSDVEDEVFGLLSYNRNNNKVTPKLLASLNKQLIGN